MHVTAKVKRLTSTVSQLTAKRKKFAEEYLVDLNGTQAAIRAGYAPSSARSRAKENLQLAVVQDYIKSQTEALESKRIATVTEVLEYLTSILRDEEREEVTVVEGCGVGFSAARNVEKKLTPKDRIKAAELLGKRYSLFTEKINVAGMLDIQTLADLMAEDDENNREP